MPKLPSREPLPSECRIYLGIDPGATGGLAWIQRSPSWVPQSQKHEILWTFKMPETTRDLWGLIQEVCSQGSEGGGVIAVLEKVGGYVGESEKAMGSRMFNFGAGYGRLQMALTAAGIPYEEIVTQTWLKGMGIPGKKKTESKTQWKNRLKAHAQRLFPRANVILPVADALLIAEFCYRKHNGLLTTREKSNA